ncbi:hypothetical protein B566_EDAN005334 [Ephemera danica]|nr:hypothetical protein B566_EDAN005334 [Ephemera danica]
MTARRRRGGSESEQAPLLTPTGSRQNSWTNQDGALSSITFSHSDSNGTSAPPKPESLVVDSRLPKNNSSSVIPDPTMTSRDRTKEFITTVRSLQGREVARVATARDPRKIQHLQRYGEFMMIARTIGKNISSTYTKLEKLTLLAKRKSLFDDRSKEIQELTYIIKEDINSLTQQLAKLQGADRNQHEAGSSGRKHLLSHSSSVVLALQSKLKSMSSEFKNVLDVRTENLKAQRTRHEQFSQSGPVASLPPSALAGPRQGSILLADDQVAIDMGGGGGATGGPPDGRMMMQSQQMMMQDDTDMYLQSRAETMQNIESTIVELGGIFQQLAHMVKEQEEMVERIDANVQDVELNVEAAHGEILKYFQSISSNRWLMIKIFAVLIFFFIFFVVFLA